MERDEAMEAKAVAQLIDSAQASQEMTLDEFSRRLSTIRRRAHWATLEVRMIQALLVMHRARAAWRIYRKPEHIRHAPVEDWAIVQDGQNTPAPPPPLPA